MKFLSDMHIHTTLSSCCKDEDQIPDNIVPLLAAKGYKKIGFADHVWVPDNLDGYFFYENQRGERHLKLKEYIQSRDWEIEVLVGCETDMVAPGIFGMTPEYKEKVDYIIMATNHFHMKGLIAQPEDETPEALAKHMIEFFVSAASSKIPDILVHPFFPFGFVEQYDKAAESISDNEFIDAFAIAAENNIAIELNQCFLGTKASAAKFSLSTPVRILSLAKVAGCKFSFGSDSHSLKGFDVQDKLQAFAEQLDLNEEDIHELAKVDDRF